jgi:hypothetical protein
MKVPSEFVEQAFLSERQLHLRHAPSREPACGAPTRTDGAVKHERARMHCNDAQSIYSFLGEGKSACFASNAALRGSVFCYGYIDT